MEYLTPAATLAAVLLVIVREWRRGTKAAQDELVRTLKATIKAQAELIAMLEAGSACPPNRVRKVSTKGQTPNGTLR